MYTKKRFLLSLLAVLLLSACSPEKDDASMLHYIKWYAMPYAETPSGYFGESLPDTPYGNSDLALRTKDAGLLPLDSNERITQYAYFLREALVEDRLLPTEALPQSALHYPNGFWILTYQVPEQSDNKSTTPNGNWVFLVSDSDGCVKAYAA